MRHLVPLLLLLLVAPGGSIADEEEPLEQILAGSLHLTRDVVLIVDVSGSMAWGNRFGKALDAVQRIAGASTDELNVCAYAFNDSAYQWSRNGKNWANLPDANAVRSLMSWLKSMETSGETNPSHALRRALRQPRGVSLVVISDGGFDAEISGIVHERGQAKRVKRGDGRAPLLVLGVGAGAEREPALMRLAKEGRGGFWVLR